jgi:hypothetical protein
MRQRIAVQRQRIALEEMRARALVELVETIAQLDTVQNKLIWAELARLDDPDHFAQIFGSSPPKDS